MNVSIVCQGPARAQRIACLRLGQGRCKRHGVVRGGCAAGVPVARRRHALGMRRGVQLRSMRVVGLLRAQVRSYQTLPVKGWHTGVLVQMQRAAKTVRRVV